MSTGDLEYLGQVKNDLEQQWIFMDFCVYVYAQNELFLFFTIRI